MSKTHERKRRPGYSLAAVVCSLCLGLYLIFSISAQTTCPTIPTDGKGFPKGTTIYYSLDASITDCTDQRCNGQVSQLTSAVTAWDTANQGNNSGVRFQPADANHPATLTFKNDFTAGTLPPGRMTPTELNSDGTIKTATITFNLGATTTDAAGQTIPVYWPAFAESFGTFHKKVTLHEVGDGPEQRAAGGGRDYLRPDERRHRDELDL